MPGLDCDLVLNHLGLRFLKNSLGIRAPRAKPKMPAADTASGAAARAAGRMVETRMLQSRMSVQ